MKQIPSALFPFCLLPSALCLLVTAFCFGSELTVDKHTLTLDDTLTVTLTLDARLDTEDVRIPTQNLELHGPAQSVEYLFDSSATPKQKVLRYLARAQWVGEARIGPVTLRRRDGGIETLDAIAIAVTSAVTVGSNDPLTTLREMIATQRDPVFIVAEADKGEAYAGEEIVVTWMMYNAANVQRYTVREVAHLDDFWSEDIPIGNAAPEQILLGGMPVQRVPVRRAALFPLRSGSLTIGEIGVAVSVMRRIGVDRFGIPFEGMLAEVTRRSPPLVIQARPIPPGPPVQIVGDVTMTCSVAPQLAEGPVVVHAIVSGWANLRGAPAPRFERAIDGDVQIVDGGFFIDRSGPAPAMTRRWRYVIFPARSGRMTIPPLLLATLTSGGERRTQRCIERTLDVVAGELPARDAHGEGEVRVARLVAQWPLVVACAISLLAIVIALPRWRRGRRRRAIARSLLRATRSETREAVDQHLAARGIDAAVLLTEHSDRGDAYRALRSLVDGAERMEVSRGELERRVMELVR